MIFTEVNVLKQPIGDILFILFGKMNFLLQYFEQQNQIVENLFVSFETLDVYLLEFDIDILCEIGRTHRVFTFEMAGLDDVVAEHTPDFFVPNVLKIKTMSEKLYDLNVLCVYPYHFWNEISKLFDFLLSNDCLFIQVLTIDLNDLW